MLNKIYNQRFFLLFSLIFAISFSGCYKDKGNYNYSVLPDSVLIEQGSYPVLIEKVLGVDQLIVEPRILYGGDLSDLTFTWEKWDEQKREFVSFYDGKVLDYKLEKNAVFPENGIYTLRLSIINKKLFSNAGDLRAGAIFSNLITLKLGAPVMRGLMVLHGNGENTDIGLISTPIFMADINYPSLNRVLTNYYSLYNYGEKLRGIGKQIISTYPSSFNQQQSVFVNTDQEHLMLDMILFQKTGDYSTLLANPSDIQGKPEFLSGVSKNQLRMLVDNGKVFYGFMIGPLLNENFNYYAAPYSVIVGRSGNPFGQPGIGGVAFDIISKRFLYTGNGNMTNQIELFPQNSNTAVNLNPADMKADLIYMDIRTIRGMTLAIMKDIQTGERYLAEFNFANNTDLTKVAQGRYQLSSLPDYQDMRLFAFGKTTVLNYYSSKNKLYQFGYNQAGVSSNLQADFGDEEITMVKILKYENSSQLVYQFSNEVLVVGTLTPEGKGKLYTYRMNLLNGTLTLNDTYHGFDRIYDANIKDQ